MVITSYIDSADRKGKQVYESMVVSNSQEETVYIETPASCDLVETIK